MTSYNPSASLTIPPEFVNRNLDLLLSRSSVAPAPDVYSLGTTHSPPAYPTTSSNPQYNAHTGQQTAFTHPNNAIPASNEAQQPRLDVQYPIKQILNQFQQHVPSNYISNGQQAKHVASIMSAPGQAQMARTATRPPPPAGTPKSAPPKSGLKNATPVYDHYKSDGPCWTPAGMFEHRVDIGQYTILGFPPFRNSTPDLYESIDLDERDLTDMDPIWLDIVKIAGGCKNIDDGRKYLKHPRRHIMLIPKSPLDSYGRPIQVGNVPYSKLRRLNPAIPEEAAEIALYKRLSQEILPEKKFLARQTPAANGTQVQRAPNAQILQQARMTPLQLPHTPNGMVQSAMQPNFAASQAPVSTPTPSPNSVSQHNTSVMTPSSNIQQNTSSKENDSDSSSDDETSSSEESQDYDDSSTESSDEEEEEEVVVVKTRAKPSKSFLDYGVPGVSDVLQDPRESQTMAMLRLDAAQKRKSKLADYKRLLKDSDDIDSENRISMEEAEKLGLVQLEDLIAELSDDIEFEQNVWQNVRDVFGTWLPCGVSYGNKYLVGSLLELEDDDDGQDSEDDVDSDDDRKRHSGSKRRGDGTQKAQYVDDMYYRVARLKYQVRKQWQRNGKKFDWFSTPWLVSTRLLKGTINHHLERRFNMDIEDSFSKSAPKFLATVAAPVNPEEEACLTHPAAIKSKRYKESKKTKTKSRSSPDPSPSVQPPSSSSRQSREPSTQESQQSFTPSSAEPAGARHSTTPSDSATKTVQKEAGVARPSKKESHIKDPKVQSRLDSF